MTMTWALGAASRSLARTVRPSTPGIAYCITDCADGTSDLSAAQGVTDTAAFAPY